MIITPLGHTEFLVDIANNQGKNVRILVDTWLSDYAIGDLMERTTKVRLDREKIQTIDAIYISHAHSDHFDPYTLMKVYGVRHSDKGRIRVSGDSEYGSFVPQDDGNKKPLLILPFTLRYLEGLIHEYLPQAEIHWLGNHETYSLKGIEITGYMWPNPEITNEDDVMMIALSNDRELLFAEIDTIPDTYDEEVQRSLYKVFTRKEYMTRCYLASRNCLEGQIPYYDLPVGKRKAFREKYIADQKEDILASYEKYEYEEYAHFPNLFTLPGFVRGFVGQGIAYPQSLSEELYALSIFPLDEIVSIESDYAKNTGYEFSQKALLPGRQYKIENGSIEQGRKECPIGELLRHREVGSDLDSNEQSMDCLVPRNDRNADERLYASGPLFPREISPGEIDAGKEQIFDILNSRFLPYWSASPVASLRHILIRNNGVYRIEFKISVILGLSQNPAETDTTGFLPMQEGHGPTRKMIFKYSTSRSGFIEVSCEENMKIDEDYWLSDILDFLEGRQEMYSSFWHRLDPNRAYRLWTCLGATYMNHDLNIAKYRLHFERARSGKTVLNFVEEVLENLKLKT